MAESVAAALPVGASAPDVTLTSTGGTTVRLADFRGERPVLVAFFPLAFTRVCTTEVCEFSEDFDQYDGRGVQVLPVSVDAAPSLAAFRAQYGLKVDLYSDFRRDASRAFGVLHPEKYYAKRAYFLIDRDGIIRWTHVEDVAAQKRDTAELLAVIDGIAQPASSA